MQLELCDSAPADWTRLAISDVCLRFTSGGTPSRKLPEYFTGSIPWVKTQELTDCVLRDSEEHITESAIANSSAKLLPANTILMAMYGATVGQLGVLARPMTCNQACAAMVVDESKVDHRFLYYQLLACRQQIKSLSTGAAQQNLSGAQVKQFVLPYPSRSEQSVVAEFLWQLDRRIDLLRQTNATLESIAQALFKSWFIDFDPVRAKAEGREPAGMDAATAALFPAEFEESALGLIPKGWKVSTLAQHVDAERGLSYKGAGLCADGEGLPMHNLNSVLEGGGYKYAGIKFYRGDYKDRHLVDPGDVIVANTEQGHEHLLIGFPAMVPARYGRALYSHHIYRVRLKPGSPLTRHTLYYLLMAPAVRDQLIGCSNGSTVNMLKAAGLQIPEFVCPPASVAVAFEAAVAPLRMQMEANVARAETLAALRDALLPRLISGKLRLSEAKAALETA
jgi:type I restriction enzyme S subunit